MTRLSVPLTAGALVGMAIVDELRPLASFAAILLVIQLQMSSARTHSRNPDAAETVMLTAEAESTAWTTGRPGLLPPGGEMSPWWEASRAIARGDSSRATRLVLDDLDDRSGRPRRWWPPHSATPDLIDPIVAALPRPLPTPSADRPEQSLLTLVWALRSTARYREASRYGAECYRVRPSTMLAIHIAACLALEGDLDGAAQWIVVGARRDGDSASDSLLLAALANDEEFERLRSRDDVRRLIATLSAGR
jgi:hypothetical protein